MGALTLILKAPVSRWANRIIGILYAVIILGFWVLGFVLGSPLVMSSFGQLHNLCLSYWLFGMHGSGKTRSVAGRCN